MSKNSKVIEGLGLCEDCGAPWMDEGNGPTQIHTDKCWTAPSAVRQRGNDETGVAR